MQIDTTKTPAWQLSCAKKPGLTEHGEAAAKPMEKTGPFSQKLSLGNFPQSYQAKIYKRWPLLRGNTSTKENAS